MKIIESKVLSYEEDLIEYENNEEFINDCKERKNNGWSLVCKNKVDFYNETIDKSPIVKYRNGKNGIRYCIYRWKRYGYLNIG